MAVVLKTTLEIDAMERAGAECARILTAVKQSIRVGTSTHDADRLAFAMIAEAGAMPLFPSQRDGRGDWFPGTASFSVNSVATHGPPDDSGLRPGDLVTVDCAIALDGWCADCASTVVVSGASEQRSRLAAAARGVVREFVSAAGPGVEWKAVVRAARLAAERAGVCILACPVGHGIGRRLHEGPALGLQGTDSLLLRPGMTFTLEPIVAWEPTQLRTCSDGWGLATLDGADACYEEVTVAVTADGVRILTPVGWEPGQSVPRPL